MQQFGLSEQDQQVFSGEAFEQQAQFAQGGHVEQVSLVDDDVEGFAVADVAEGGEDELRFELRWLGVELEGGGELAEQMGVGVQGAGERGDDRVAALGALFEVFAQHGFADAGCAKDDAEAAVLGVDVEDIGDALLLRQQGGLKAVEGFLGEAEGGFDHVRGSLILRRVRAFCTGSRVLASPMRLPA